MLDLETRNWSVSIFHFNALWIVRPSTEISDRRLKIMHRTQSKYTRRQHINSFLNKHVKRLLWPNPAFHICQITVEGEEEHCLSASSPDMISSIAPYLYWLCRASSSIKMSLHYYFPLRKKTSILYWSRTVCFQNVPRSTQSIQYEMC